MRQKIPLLFSRGLAGQKIHCLGKGLQMGRTYGMARAVK